MKGHRKPADGGYHTRHKETTQRHATGHHAAGNTRPTVDEHRNKHFEHLGKHGGHHGHRYHDGDGKKG